MSSRPPGLEHAPHFAHRPRRVGDEVRDEKQNRRVERAVVDRERLDGADAKLDVAVRLEPLARRLEHRPRLVDRDDLRDARRQRFGDVPGAAAEVADDPVVVEQIEQREQVGALADHLGPHHVPELRRVAEKDDGFVAPLGEHAVGATLVLARSGADRDLAAHDRPQ